MNCFKLKILGALAASIIAAYLFVVWATSRTKITGQLLNDPAVYALWHGRSLFIPFVIPRHRRKDFVVLTSWHTDGQIIGEVAKWFGFTVVHGSPKKGGARAAVQLVKLLKQGKSILITPDAPPQKAFQPSKGYQKIAELAEVPLVWIETEAVGHKVLNTRDQYCVLLPFGKINVKVNA